MPVASIPLLASLCGTKLRCVSRSVPLWSQHVNMLQWHWNRCIWLVVFCLFVCRTEMTRHSDKVVTSQRDCVFWSGHDGADDGAVDGVPELSDSGDDEQWECMEEEESEETQVPCLFCDRYKNRSSTILYFSMVATCEVCGCNIASLFFCSGCWTLWLIHCNTVQLSTNSIS